MDTYYKNESKSMEFPMEFDMWMKTFPSIDQAVDFSWPFVVDEDWKWLIVSPHRAPDYRSISDTGRHSQLSEGPWLDEALNFPKIYCWNDWTRDLLRLKSLFRRRGYEIKIK